jgi:hypothetical protein
MTYYMNYVFTFNPRLSIYHINPVKIWIDKHILLGKGADFEHLYYISDVTFFSEIGVLIRLPHVTEFRIEKVPNGPSLDNLSRYIDELIFMLNIDPSSYKIYIQEIST